MSVQWEATRPTIPRSAKRVRDIKVNVTRRIAMKERVEARRKRLTGDPSLVTWLVRVATDGATERRSNEAGALNPTGARRYAKGSANAQSGKRQGILSTQMQGNECRTTLGWKSRDAQLRRGRTIINGRREKRTDQDCPSWGLVWTGFVVEEVEGGESQGADDCSFE